MLPPTGRFAWWLPPAGLLGGITLGIVARWWMRLISTDPEFTWTGTIFIVGAFGLAGFAQALAAAARRAGWRRRWTTMTRIGAGVLTLPVFTGAGAIMLPTVLAGALARWRRFRPAVRAILALASLVVPAITVRDVAGDPGLGVGPVLGLVLFAATYVGVITALGATVAPIEDGWRVGRAGRVLGVVGGVLAVAGLTALIVGPS